MSVRTLSHVTRAAAEDCGELSQRQQWLERALRAALAINQRGWAPRLTGLRPTAAYSQMFSDRRSKLAQGNLADSHSTELRGGAAVLLSSLGTPASTPASCLPGNGTSQASTCVVDLSPVTPPSEPVPSAQLRRTAYSVALMVFRSWPFASSVVPLVVVFYYLTQWRRQ